MLRAKSLDSVTFTENTLFIQEEFQNAKVMGKMRMSAAGTHIVYQATINTPYITLDSKEYGWVDDTQKEALEAMWETLGATYTLTYDDDTTETVRMATEKNIVFEPLFEGACKYRAVIPLAKA